MSAPIVHVCSCGTPHSRAEWEALEYVGTLEDEEERLELRNCQCGSTRSLVTWRRVDLEVGLHGLRAAREAYAATMRHLRRRRLERLLAQAIDEASTEETT